MRKQQSIPSKYPYDTRPYMSGVIVSIRLPIYVKLMKDHYIHPLWDRIDLRVPSLMHIFRPTVTTIRFKAFDLYDSV